MAAPDLLRLLDCVAISDALDGMLVYGASADTLESLADGLAERLRLSGARSVDQVWLGSSDTEDTLWGVPDLPPGLGGRGLLVPPPGRTRIVLVADLSRMSLAAARAGVIMLGSAFVDIERRGQARRMAVRHRWIAGLAHDDRAGVSRHLIDRFAVRVQLGTLSRDDRRLWLERRLARDEGAALDSLNPSGIPPNLRRTVRVQRAAIDQALAIAAGEEGEGIRAPMALLRLAEALARLDGEGQVDALGLRRAAEVLGLDAAASSRASQTDGSHEESTEAATPPDSRTSESVVAGDQRLVVTVEGGESGNADTRAATAGDALVGADSELATLQVPAETMNYESPSQPQDYASLRLPWRQSRVASGGRGHIIGTRRADVIKDLAVLETLLAAAPFQMLRQSKLGQKSQHIIVRRSDLRSYRRAPPAGELLVLVLDYTSVVGREWLGALVPFLSEAYAARAELCVVRVGARSAQNPLRADRLLARNILVPSVAAALDEPAGRATPLADGLSLALRTIQQTLGHGRSSTRRATLIVVTDGRGNVPLEASRQGHWRGRVGRQGVEDAKRVARELRALAHLRRVLIDPEPALMHELPRALARTLDAERVTMGMRDE